MNQDLPTNMDGKTSEEAWLKRSSKSLQCASFHNRCSGIKDLGVY